MFLRIRFVLWVLLSIIIYCVADKTSALTFELIHRYAPESPFFSANFTHEEIDEQLTFQTRNFKKRMNLIHAITGREDKSSLDLHVVRPMLDVDFRFTPYLVKVGLGTFTDGVSSHKSYLLELDTGSHITWLQCEDCKKNQNYCYRQVEPPYPNSKSISYKPLPCDRHPLCYRHKCIEDSCSYYVGYEDNSHSEGILAHEYFTFPSHGGQEEIVKFVFGCGIRNKYSYGHDKDLKMAGIFGLGWGRHSFVNQIHSISKGRFSYCFPPLRQAVRGFPVYLRFGSDIPLYSSLHRTKLLQYDGNPFYYVNLLDISVNEVRLNIPSSYFRKESRNSGCIFDTGTSPTYVSPPAYQMLRHAVITYITRYAENLKIVGPMGRYDLCYKRSKLTRGHTDLPSVTFHFEGNADLVVKPEIAFSHKINNVQYEYICLAMVRNEDDRTIIGSDIQANQFMVYDLLGRTLYFGHRDCSRNS